MSSAVDPELDPDVGADATAAASYPLLLAVIAAGGALGTLARYELGVHLRTAGSYGFSYATLVANLSGAFALGLLVAVVARHWPRSHYLRPALGTGVLGGYTTFSTLMVETVQRLDHGHASTGVLYLVVTVAGGLAAALAGMALGDLGRHA
ncbi:MAG: fluoride exporter [Frankiales bacterium]|jgi:CrcB protein|nr:fluoride exporter [Frankiales bacterium]